MDVCTVFFYLKKETHVQIHLADTLATMHAHLIYTCANTPSNTYKKTNTSLEHLRNSPHFRVSISEMGATPISS